MTSEALLDANVLIALVIVDHEHHAEAARHVAELQRVAICPITEGALVRFLLRVGESRATVMQLLLSLHESSRCEFWADEISYLDVDMGDVVGHRQVTDAYLAALARHRGATLVTFDRALAASRPDVVTLLG